MSEIKDKIKVVDEIELVVPAQENWSAHDLCDLGHNFDILYNKLYVLSTHGAKNKASLKRRVDRSRRHAPPGNKLFLKLPEKNFQGGICLYGTTEILLALQYVVNFATRINIHQYAKKPIPKKYIKELTNIIDKKLYILKKHKNSTLPQRDIHDVIEEKVAHTIKKISEIMSK